MILPELVSTTPELTLRKIPDDMVNSSPESRFGSDPLTWQVAGEACQVPPKF